MAYFDGAFAHFKGGYYESCPQTLRDDCFVFDMSRGGALVASRTRSRRRSPEYLREVLPDGELDFLVKYLESYAAEPLMVSTSYGWALAISVLFPSTSLCVLSVPSIGGDNFFRVAEKSGWDFARSPLAMQRHFRITGVRDQHVTESGLLFESLCACFSPFPNAEEFNCDPREELRSRALAVAAYASRRARIAIEERIFASEELDLPLFVAFLLLLLFGGREDGTQECVGVYVLDHKGGIELSVIDRLSGTRAQIFDFFSEVCGRAQIPFEYFLEDGRTLARVIPVRKDWAYLGIKSPTE